MDMKADPGINISSVILGVAPENVAEVSRQLAALAGVEIHAAAEDGRMIVTIESRRGSLSRVDHTMSNHSSALSRITSD